MTGPAISVVVMGYRNQATIERSVRSVLTQVSPEPFETIVVTSGGDDSGAVIRSSFPEVLLYESPTRLLPGAARNVGARMTSADIVAFLAADCVAMPGWVERRIAAHRSGNEAVAGAMEVPPRARAVEVASHFLVHPTRSPDRPSGPAAQSFAYSLSYTRGLLDRMGPFDETLRVGEDTAATAHLNDLGVTPWFEPAVRAQHLRHPATASALVRDQHRRGVLSARGRALPIGRNFRALQRVTWPGARWIVVTAKSVTWWWRRMSWVFGDTRSSTYVPAGSRPAVSFWIAVGSVAYQLGCRAEWLKNWSKPR